VFFRPTLGSISKVKKNRTSSWSFRLILAPFDFVIILVTVLSLVFVVSLAWSGSGKKAVLVAEANGKRSLWDLGRDQTLYLKGPLGDSVVEIRNGKASFTDSPCRDKICVHAGVLSRVGDWAACLPNRVIVHIEGSQNEKDSGLDVIVQ